MRRTNRMLAARLIGIFAIAAAFTVTAQTASAPAGAQPGAPILTAPVRTSSSLPPRTSARAVAVIDGDTGTVLYDKNANERLAPASLTKIMTALVALQQGDARRRVIARFSPEELDSDGTTMGLLPGDDVSVEDLIYGLMLPSGNDAALVLARSIAGSEAAFVDLMNRAAAANGLTQTMFANPHGLDHELHLTSASDIAQLSRIAMRDPRFRAVVSARRWTVSGARTYSFSNRNPFLSAYSGADGVKIGWTEAAGATIVASASRNGHRVIVALMDTRDRTGEAAALMDWAFATYHWPGPPLADAPSDD